MQSSTLEEKGSRGGILLERQSKSFNQYMVWQSSEEFFTLGGMRVERPRFWMKFISTELLGILGQSQAIDIRG